MGGKRTPSMLPLPHLADEGVYLGPVGFNAGRSILIEQR